MMSGSKEHRRAGSPVIRGAGKRPFELKTGDENDVGTRATEADEKKKRTAMMGDDERE
jgi:hypothetical protein